MAKESFLFVPYHAGQQSLAEIKLASSDARSHAAAVSRQRRDKKRLRAQTALRADDNLTVDDAEASHDAQNSDVSSDSRPITKTLRPRNKTERRQHMRAMQFSWRAGNVSNAFRFCNGTRIDPFGSAPDSAFGQAVVDYYWQVIAPVNQPIYAIFNVTNIYTSFWNELMMDEDYRPAGLAVVGAIMQRVANPDFGTSVDVACHRASAMSRLRRKYQDAIATGRQEIDDMTIITVLALANLARFLGDTRSYEMHRRMMKDMVHARGGLDSLGQGGLAKVVLLQWDSFWIFETDGAPLFSDARPEHVPVYPAFPLSGDLRETFVKLPVGFQSLILKGKLSVETIEVLDRVVDVIDDGLDSIANWNMNHSKLRKYNDFVEACPCLNTSDAEKTTIEKDICLALFLYCFSTFTVARSNTSYTSLLARSLHDFSSEQIIQPILSLSRSASFGQASSALTHGGKMHRIRSYFLKLTYFCLYFHD